MSSSSGSAIRLPGRAWAAVLALLLPWVAGTAGAAPVDDLSDTWRINGNGFPGEIVVRQSPDGQLSGTIYGEAMRGFYSPAQRVAVLMRGPAAAPIQAYVATVSVNGRSMSGRFYALNAGSAGGGTARNVFGFTARRGTAVAAPRPVRPASPPGPAAIERDFDVFNRPAEFGRSQRGALSLTVGGDGEVRGSIFGEPLLGHYARGTGTLAFVRMRGGEDFQLFVARPLAGSFAGDFYTLTVAAGGSIARVKFDWSAEVASTPLVPSLTGYEVVYGTVDLQQSGNADAPARIAAWANCPAGKIALGAGWRAAVSPASWDRVNWGFEIRSAAEGHGSGGRAVSVEVRNANVDPLGAAQAIAICVDPIPGLRRASSDSSNTFSDPFPRAEASCGAGETLVGTGFAAFWRNMNLNAFGPTTATAAASRGTMQNLASLDDNWVRAHVACAPAGTVPPVTFLVGPNVRLAGRESQTLRLECPDGQRPLAMGFGDNSSSASTGNHAIVQSMVPDGRAVVARISNRSIVPWDQLLVHLQALCAAVR